MAQREEWRTRTGFILAAAGSAIGLGDVWRWPYIAYTNGGGAFFVPYLFAFLTAGIPILILEYAIGHRYRGSTPLSFRRMGRSFEWVGWWQVAISFVIGCYYSVIIAWALSFTLFSFGRTWGNDTEAFFLQDYLNATAQPGAPRGLVLSVLIPLLIVWAGVLFTIGRGVQKGIEAASRVMIPLFAVLFIILVIRAVTLPGAADGLNALFKPDWSVLNPFERGEVWIAAYAQIFFSLSIAFAIMVTYASYLARKADLTNTALIVGFSNASTELLAGIGVFAALGFMAQTTGTAVERVAEDGIPLIFIAFPQLIDQLPGLNTPFAVVFFFSLVIAGFTSQISIVEVYVSGMQEKLNMSRAMAVAIGGGAGALLSIAFATRGGLYILDAADHFINEFGAVTAGFLEVVFVAWILRRLDELQAHANQVSDIAVGAWWKGSLMVITPAVLGVMLVFNLYTNITERYEQYPVDFLLSYGWSVALATLVAGILISFKSWDRTVQLSRPTEV